jgi:asparagine synthase (glutamine-hydrolysing)
VGVFLSSGIDSTLIAGLAASHSPRPQAFTVGFADHPDLDELGVAAATAKRFGLDHVPVTLPMAEIEATCVEWLTALDQPSIDGLNVYVISKAIRARGIKVALSGLGADELFGGYPSFREVPKLRRMVRTLRPLPGVVRRSLAALATVRRPAAARAKLNDMVSGDGSVRTLCLQRRRLMSDAQLAKLGITSIGTELDPDYLPPGAAPDVDAESGNDLVRAVSQYEFRLYQGNMLLRDADADAMAHGLELRVPFLDQRLLNLAHTIPGQVRLPPGATGKYLLRQAFPDLLNPALQNRPKQGFVLPIGRWLAGSLRPRCEQALSALKESEIVASAGVEAVWKAFLSEPSSSMWSRALALVVLGEFARRQDVSVIR